MIYLPKSLASVKYERSCYFLRHAIAPLGIYGRPRAAGEAVTNRIFRNLRCRPIAHRLLARRRRRPAYCVAEIDDDEHAGRGDATKSLMRGRHCEPFFPFADPPYQKFVDES